MRSIFPPRDFVTAELRRAERRQREPMCKIESRMLKYPVPVVSQFLL